MLKTVPGTVFCLHFNLPVVLSRFRNLDGRGDRGKILTKFKEIHLAQLWLPVGQEFTQFRPFVWLVRDHCPSQGYFVGECQDGLRAFLCSHFPHWDLSESWNSAQLGALQLKVGLGKGKAFLDGQSKQFSLLGCNAVNFTAVLTRETTVLFRE